MDYNIPNKLFDIPNDKEEEAIPGGIRCPLLGYAINRIKTELVSYDM